MITPLPDAPSRADPPADFITTAETFLASLATLVSEVNASSAGFDAPKWVSGTNYVAGNHVWSPADGQTYRRTTNGAGVTDPSQDQANWLRVSGGPFPVIGPRIDVAIDANTDDWNAAGLSTAVLVRASVSANYELRGIAGGQDGQIKFVVNLGPGTLTLKSAAVSSAFGNRIQLAGATQLKIPVNGAVMLLYDAGGGVQSWVVVGAQPAEQAAMEAETQGLNVTADVLKYGPSAAKFWLSVSVAAGTPTLDEDYNVASITDTATGRLTVTLQTPFSSATWCCVPGCERTVTTLAEANDRKVTLEFGSQAAGSFILECKDSTTTTMALKDPETWWAAGYGDLP